MLRNRDGPPTKCTPTQPTYHRNIASENGNTHISSDRTRDGLPQAKICQKIGYKHISSAVARFLLDSTYVTDKMRQKDCQAPFLG
jgi:hypothetical protein